MLVAASGCGDVSPLQGEWSPDLGRVQQNAVVAESAGDPDVLRHLEAIEVAVAARADERRSATCVGTGEGANDCGVLTRALYEALTRDVEPYFFHQKDEVTPLTRRRSYGETLLSAFRGASTHAERLASLGMLRFGKVEMPVWALEGAASMTDPELVVLLDAFSVKLLPALAVCQGVYPVASDRSRAGAVRARATRLLASPECSELVGKLAEDELTSLNDLGGSPLMDTDLPYAVGVCGRACERSLSAWYLEPGVRRDLSERALVFAPDRSLVDAILTLDGRSWSVAQSDILARITEPFVATRDREVAP